MKRTFLRIALFCLLFAGTGFIDNSGQLKAQHTLETDLLVEPSGNFVSSQEALNRIDIQITGIKNLLALLTEGTPAYQAAWSRYLYHNEVIAAINDGKTVPQSIVEGLKVMSADSYEMPKGVLQQYKTQMVALLRL